MMADEFDVTELSAELDAAIDERQPDPPPPPPAADERTEVDDEAALAAAYDAATGAPDDEKNWSREMRRLADAALEANGVDPAKRHEAGISRREAVRRLFHAEQMLRENPAEGLSHLASAYVGADDGTKLAVADRVLKALGIESQGRLAEAERQRLQYFEAQQQALQQQVAAAHQHAIERVQAFAKDRPHFQAVRPVMAALMQSGAAHDLDSAYQLAVATLPKLKAEQEAALRAEAQRQARKARATFPRSRSVPVPETEVEEDPVKIMEAVYDRMMS